MTNKSFFIFLIVLVSHSCLSQEQALQNKALVIKNVNVIQMTSPNSVLAGATVVLRNSKIEALNGTIPKDAVILDGKGKWLIPGLIDIHVHIPTDFSTRPKRPTQGLDITFNTQDLMTPF